MNGPGLSWIITALKKSASLVESASKQRDSGAKKGKTWQKTEAGLTEEDQDQRTCCSKFHKQVKVGMILWQCLGRYSTLFFFHLALDLETNCIVGPDNVSYFFHFQRQFLTKLNQTNYVNDQGGMPRQKEVILVKQQKIQFVKRSNKTAAISTQFNGQQDFDWFHQL